MAIKFSSSMCLVRDLQEIAKNSVRYSLKPEETDRLSTILKEFDELHITEGYNTNEALIEPHIQLNITREFVQTSRDPNRSAELFHQIHGLLGGHFVDTQIYIWLGRAFEELGIGEMIEPDLKIAIDDARRRELGQGKEFAAWPLDYSKTFCPNAAITKEKNRRSGRKEIDYSDQYESD